MFTVLALLHIGSTVCTTANVTHIASIRNVIRDVFNLPRLTHRNLIEPISQFPHVFTMLTNRFLNFYETLYSSPKSVISNLRQIQENDCRSNFGINIRYISLLNNNCDIRNCRKNSVKYFPINEEEAWRIDLLRQLIGFKYNPGFRYLLDEIAILIEILACA